MIPSLQNHPWMIINAFLILLVLHSEARVGGARFTITNRCSEPIWPVVLDNATQQIEQYELIVSSSIAFQRPNGWTGSVWGKTGCVFNDSGSASCATGDTPGFTRAEFMLASPDYTDFYAVNLLDGFNLPLVVKPSGGSGYGLGSRCRSVDCIADINQICPTELRTQGSAVCRSACQAFGTPENCCTGNYSEPPSDSSFLEEGMPPSYPPQTNPQQRKSGKNRAKEIITVVSASASGVIIVSIIICCFLKRRKNSPQRKRNRDVENLLLQHKSALVYKYMPNKSLDKFLGNNGDGILDLKKLYEIAVGIAKGLEYLHTGCITRIVHFDIKPQNILLDQDLCPKILDFRLAKLCKKKQSVLSVLGMRGTAGYIAPEVFSRNYGGVSHKSDVYSYGMMLLDMAGAKKDGGTVVTQSSENYFPNKVYEQVIIDVTSSLDDESTMIQEEEEKRRKMMLIGFWCIQTIPSERPSICKVVEMLEGNLDSIQIPLKPFLFSTVIPNQETPSSSFSANVEIENMAGG